MNNATIGYNPLTNEICWFTEEVLEELPADTSEVKYARVEYKQETCPESKMYKMYYRNNTIEYVYRDRTFDDMTIQEQIKIAYDNANLAIQMQLESEGIL